MTPGPHSPFPAQIDIERFLSPFHSSSSSVSLILLVFRISLSQSLSRSLARSHSCLPIADRDNRLLRLPLSPLSIAISDVLRHVFFTGSRFAPLKWELRFFTSLSWFACLFSESMTALTCDSWPMMQLGDGCSIFFRLGSLFFLKIACVSWPLFWGTKCVEFKRNFSLGYGWRPPNFTIRFLFSFLPLHLFASLRSLTFGYGTAC